MAISCRYGKLAHPTKRRKCKKAPRGRAAKNASAYSPRLQGARRRRRRR